MSTINHAAAAKNFYEYWMDKGYEKRRKSAVLVVAATTGFWN